MTPLECVHQCFIMWLLLHQQAIQCQWLLPKYVHSQFKSFLIRIAWFLKIPLVFFSFFFVQQTAIFDAGARFNGKAPVIPPAPPGYLPNAAQVAAMQGQQVRSVRSLYNSAAHATNTSNKIAHFTFLMHNTSTRPIKIVIYIWLMAFFSFSLSLSPSHSWIHFVGHCGEE